MSLNKSVLKSWFSNRTVHSILPQTGVKQYQFDIDAHVLILNFSLRFFPQTGVQKMTLKMNVHSIHSAD